MQENFVFWGNMNYFEGIKMCPNVLDMAVIKFRSSKDNAEIVKTSKEEKSQSCIRAAEIVQVLRCLPCLGQFWFNPGTTYGPLSMARDKYWIQVIQTSSIKIYKKESSTYTQYLERKVYFWDHVFWVTQCLGLMSVVCTMNYVLLRTKSRFPECHNDIKACTSA